MADFDVIGLTKKLISFDTSGPQGGEELPAKYLGDLLSSDGFTVRYHTFAPGRPTLLAEKGLSDGVSPVVLTGHLDTVPLGASSWSFDPFAGEISDGKLFGRGSSDMKGGVAAMVCAAQRAFRTGAPRGGVRLLFTAAEEPGCLGAKSLAESGFDVGQASAIIVGEPTSNLPYLGHNGVPTIILGPGEPGQAHRTDEFCLLGKLEEAVAIYTNILLRIGEIHT